ncbi:MAG TPA: carboxypeptidase-like regulatory domain-containing protein [Polyangiaceae bacterium]|nr:carboxypeptidase-like regulatory domain-containing protein [Polyangiaceae bacterium]
MRTRLACTVRGRTLTSSVTVKLALALALVLTPRGAGAQVSGTVRDGASGLPVPGARVRLQATKVEAITDSAGAFVLPGVSGAGKVVVAAVPGSYYGSATVVAPATGVDLVVTSATAVDNPAVDHGTPESCGSCHPSFYTDWKASPMGKAGTNTWVYDVYDGTGAKGGAGLGGFVYTRDSVLAKKNPASECASCHQPERWWSTPYAPLDPIGSGTAVVAHGVSCAVCHTIARVDATKPNYPGLWPGVVTVARPAQGDKAIFGVLGDVSYQLSGSMRAAYNPQLRADVCAACHQDKNDPDENGDFESPRGVISEPTYLEWKASPYADPSDRRYATCVDCHMRPTGEAQACSVQLPPLQRPPGDVRSHAFPGTSAEFLEAAVSLTLTANRAGGEVAVEVSVRNDKTGHHVPTGVTIRNMVLLVEATRARDGAALKHTGAQVVHELGGVGDPRKGYFAGLPGKLFAKVNGDVNGKGPTFFTDATSILWDTRIPALGVDATKYTFDAPLADGEVRVRARVIYRRSWRALVDAKSWTKDGHGAPLEDVTAPNFGHLMAQAEATVPADGACAGAGCDAGPQADAGGVPPVELTSPAGSTGGCACRAAPVDGGGAGALASACLTLALGVAASRRRGAGSNRGL